MPLDLTLLGGSQAGGNLNHISTSSTTHFARRPVSALIIGSRLSGDQDIEYFYSLQQTRLEEGEGEGDVAVAPAELFDLDIHYLHLGGTVLSKKLYGGRAFMSGGLGLSHLSPSLAGASEENRASLSLGIGARWMPTRQLGLRVEARAYGTLFNSNASIFCSGGCQFSVSGDLLTQYAIFAGVVVRLE